MNLDILKQIVKVAKDEGVAELKVDSKDFKVEVKFATAGSVQYAQPMVHHAPAAQAAPVAAVSTKAHIPVETGFHFIKSPFVGTFYGSPSPTKPVYAKIGDKVKVGQPLCVLEAMKIMNEIEADVAGEIVEICVENESLVEFGQALFKIKPN
jgi:acetyl-CoA carboxylase biotin carboxyl carrier protein